MYFWFSWCHWFWMLEMFLQRNLLFFFDWYTVMCHQWSSKFNFHYGTLNFSTTSSTVTMMTNFVCISEYWFEMYFTWLNYEQYSSLPFIYDINKMVTELITDVKEVIISQYFSRWKQSVIARRLLIPRLTITSVVYRYRKRGSVDTYSF